MWIKVFIGHVTGYFFASACLFQEVYEQKDTMGLDVDKVTQIFENYTVYQSYITF